MSRIAEIVRAVTSLAGFDAHPGEHAVGSEGAQKLVMAFASLVDAGEDRVHDADRRAAGDASARAALACAHGPIGVAANSSARTTLVPMR